MMSSYFITGTDTGVGKTVVTLAIMETLKRAGYKVGGMKPVSSGCDYAGGELVSEDAMLIKMHNSVDLPYASINPIAFNHPCSPNIAAEMEDKQVDLDPIIGSFDKIARCSDVVLVEGIGGWRCPVFSGLGMADIAKSLNIPVILVVGIKLGCLNHALLSVEGILRDNVVLAGWVANVIDPGFQYTQATVNSLKGLIKVPLLGLVPYQTNLDYERLHKCISVINLMPESGKK